MSNIKAIESAENEIKRLEKINGEVLGALKMGLQMWRSTEPRKLDEALTWRQNDEKAMNAAKQAIAHAEPETDIRD